MVDAVKNIKKYFKNSIKQILFRDLLSKLNSAVSKGKQRSPGYLEWINSDLVELTNEFVEQQQLLGSCFIKSMNISLESNRSSKYFTILPLLLNKTPGKRIDKGVNLLGDSTSGVGYANNISIFFITAPYMQFSMNYNHVV